MSYLPGKKCLGMRAAYRAAPVIYRLAGHQHQPADLPYGGGLQEALRDDIMQGGNDATQAKAQEHACSHPPILRGSEHVPLGDDNGCDAQHTDDNQVDEARLWVTVERIIKPRHKASHHQKSNTRVIQFREETGDPSEWQQTVWNSHEKERQRMAPKKNNPKTTFSCRGAAKEMFGRNI